MRAWPTSDVVVAGSPGSWVVGSLGARCSGGAEAAQPWSMRRSQGQSVGSRSGVGGRCARSGRPRPVAEPESFRLPAAGRWRWSKARSGPRPAGRRPGRRSPARSGCRRSRGRAGYAGRCLSARGSGPRPGRVGGVEPPVPAVSSRGLRVLVAKQVIRQPSSSVSRSWAPGMGKSRGGR